MPRRLFAIVFFAAASAAQTQSVIETARQAPPEIFADAVVKLVERGGVASGQRADLLNEAFQAAKHARQPVRLAAVPGTGTNTRAALRDAAGRLGLDALSLESRVLRLIALTDQGRAREMFQSLDHPALEARRCGDPMIADASAYYETAGLLSQGQAQVLMPALGPAGSPGELASFARVVGTMAVGAKPALPPDDFRVLTGALAFKLETAAPDYRSFSMTADELRAGLEGIAARARELGFSTAPLAEGVRKLVIAQMSSPRCEPDFGDAKALVEWFNRAGRSFRGDAPAIDEEELIPLKTLGGFIAAKYFESGDEKEIADELGRLPPALGKPEWRALLAQFLAKFSEWKPDAPPIDVFHLRMTLLRALFQLIPPGEDRDAVLASAVDVLRSSGVEGEYPAEWLVEVRSFAGSAMEGRAKLLAAFRASGDPGLAVFAALESVSAEAR